MKHIVITGDKVPIKAWVADLSHAIEDEAMKQLQNLSSMPFIHKHIAVMPDVHWGNGTSVGTVIATKGAIIPAAVGVDIGCGMMAMKLNMTADDLPDNLFGIRSAIEAAVPHGRTNNGGAGDRGAWGNVPQHVDNAFISNLEHKYLEIVGKHPKIGHLSVSAHLGTLGTGNHFIELCLDESNGVWVMLHSGSRGVGNKIGTYFIQKAKADMQRWFINLPDANLAYLPEGSENFNDYMEAVGWAQDYAHINRELMMEATINAISKAMGRPVYAPLMSAVNCHHNYVARENHFGENILVTRKGAVQARKGTLGIIPGSMGAKSFIVSGKGVEQSFSSCSHGAGRKMSRTKAKATFTLQDHAQATAGVECRKDSDVIDETPMAYKDIDEVMSSQSDLVDIVHTLKQVVCVKG